MTLQDLGSIGEFVAAIATLVTLAYLAIQIRQNTRTVRTSTFHEAIRDMSDSIDQLGRDAELTRIWYDGLREPDSLSPEEQRRFATYMTSVLRRYENLVYQTRHGTLDEAAWAGVRAQFRYVFSQPGAVAWWERASNLFNPDLAEAVAEDIRAGVKLPGANGAGSQSDPA